MTNVLLTVAVTVTDVQFERFVKTDTAKNQQRVRTPWGVGDIRGRKSPLLVPLFAVSSLPLSLPSSQRPLSSPFLTSFGAHLLTYKMWSLSTSVERHDE